MTLKEANEFIRNKFVNGNYMYLYLGQNIELGVSVLGDSIKTVEAIVAVSESNDGLAFTINKPELSKPKTYPRRERVYSVRFDRQVLESKTLLDNLTLSFLSQVRDVLRSEFGDQDLIGTTPPSLESPGFEGQLIIEIEPGIYEMRIYTDLMLKSSLTNSHNTL